MNMRWSRKPRRAHVKVRMDKYGDQMEESRQHKAFRKLISPQALALVAERHLNLSEEQMRQRLYANGNIGRVATYDSRGAFLKALADVHQSAGKRFAKIMAATSKQEFDAANGSEELRDRICLHEEGRVGKGVNDLGRPKTVKAYRSCYSFE